MQSPSTVTLIGGSGFLGRYITQRLASQGHLLRIAVRDPERAAFLKPFGATGQITPIFADITRPQTLTRALAGANAVINLVGILAERAPGDFGRVQAEGAGHAARIAAEQGATQYIHISAIGADPASPSAYGRSKAEGEALVRGHFPRATILRPSIVFGPEDQFFNRFAAMARIAPVMPVIAGGTRFQPVYVGDVAAAVVEALARGTDAAPLYELGGPDIRSFRELLGYILAETGRNRPLVEVPAAAANLLARMPMSGLTTDQLRMLERDNIANPALPGLAELGLVATPIALRVGEYLARYRAPGPRRQVSPLVSDRT